MADILLFFATPSRVISLLLFLGLFLWPLKYRRRTARLLLAAAFALFLLAGSGILGGLVLARLERDPALPAPPAPPAAAVVLLGVSGGPARADDARLGILAAVEAIRRHPGLRSVYLVPADGPASPERDLELEAAAGLLRRLLAGEAVDIHLLPGCSGPVEGFRRLAPILDHTSFLLVAAAYRMPRALLAARDLGGHPVPAPSGRLSGGASRGLRSLWPTPEGLLCSDLACRELCRYEAARLRRLARALWHRLRPPG
ncbi:YdcF family protein [Dissulfurirhabdus thermomarina]|uniref:YdcF family protein n=1 Tax=Dissulfurirhabdus thermomarina TaxID=1765737 RepID=A0A6N9TNV4_DISTH|nr:ElyC/SanA/YdcF family protein [Dissulfurirhabdus thermomarina]NDY42972.1 YdcF family protein [Dissulfurirhabdus thermomarina]NMX23949.1 YdcF family protein [Dissulfurirhabdus thermomarina]